MSARLQAAVEAQVTAGAPGALAWFEAPRACLAWGGAAGQLARGEEPCAAAGRRLPGGERHQDYDRRRGPQTHP